MGLRDLFRGKSDQEPDNQKTSESEKDNQTDNEDNQKSTNNEQKNDTQTTGSNASVVTSVLTAKQNLADFVQQYNDHREALQDLLFDRQKEIQTAADQLNTKMTNAQKAVNDTGSQVTQIQNEMEEAIQKVSASYVEKQTELNGRIKENQDKAGNLIDQVKEINAEIRGLNSKQQQLVQAETDISAKFKSEKDPAVIVTLADQYRDDIENNKGERDKNATTIKAVDAKQKSLKQQLQDVRAKLTADQKQLSETNNQLEEVQKKIASDDEGRSKKLDELTNGLTKDQTDLVKLKDDLDKKNAELDAVNSDIGNWLGIPVPVNGLVLDSDSEIILDMDGLTNEQFALMKRVVKRFIDRGIEHVGLYTSQFTLNMTDQIARWTSNLEVKDGIVSVYNPLYNLQHQGKIGAKYQLPDNAVSDDWDDGHTERTLVLPNGWTLKVHYYNNGEQISTVDSYKKDHLAESSTLTTAGQLTSNLFYNDDGTKNRDEYYSQSGLGVLNVRYEQDEVKQVELLNPVGMQVQAFDNIDGFTQWWLKNDFSKNGLLVGPIENEQYRQFLKATQGEPIALTTGEVAASDDFKTWATGLPKQQYLVDNYETEMKIINLLNQPLTISLLDPRNLPVSLGTPLGDVK